MKSDTQHRDSFVLLCKSYRQDVRRVERLMASIERYNTDALPVVVCVPEVDMPIFAERLAGYRHTLICDESVVAAHPEAAIARLLDRYRQTPGALSQQVVKSEVWRLIGCSAYLCLDSDTVFIRSFQLTDFLAPDGHPYSIVHQDKEFFQLAITQRHPEVWANFVETAQQVQRQLGRRGPMYSYGPFPVLWSTRVWKELDAHLAQRGWTLWDAIERVPSEAHWYGEALLTLGSIPLHLVGPLCRCYHYDWQARLAQQAGETETTLAEHFLCVVYQSNWDEALDHQPRRSQLSHWAKAIKRLWR